MISYFWYSFDMSKINKALSFALIIALIVLAFYLSNRNKKAPELVMPDQINSEVLPGIQTGSTPWPPENDHLKERLKMIGLPQLLSEGTALHTHQHLDIYINGNHLEIPSEIGVNTKAGFTSPIHTHDISGVVHVESPTVQTFYVGQFFDIWGVRFTADCLGTYCATGDNLLRVYSNGQLVTENTRDLELQPHQEIVITYGTENQLPSPIPSSYDFPPDY
jgi:hypothetical protein